MISIQQALKMIQRHQPAPGTHKVDLSEGLDRVLAEDILAPESSPRATSSSMDGFAIRWTDTRAWKEGKPLKLSVVGESQAGEPYRKAIKTGQAVRISTGAIMPDGTDTVVPLEDVREEDDQITLLSMVQRKQHVRCKGEEFRKGELLLPHGHHLTPASLGLLASFGIRRISVFRRPEVGILITGGELVDIHDKIEPWQIRDANGMMLREAVRKSDAHLTFQERCKDDLNELQKALCRGSQAAQILLVSGGVSVGSHDVVKRVAREEGFQTIFWRVRQKPGKPLFFARKEEQLLFGLPGNPVSALSCYIYYVHPLLQRLQGKEFRWESRSALFKGEFENHGKRSLFLRVQIVDQEERIWVRPLKKQDSHMISSMALAQGFLLLEPGQKLHRGDRVRVYLYPWR